LGQTLIEHLNMLGFHQFLSLKITSFFQSNHIPLLLYDRQDKYSSRWIWLPGMIATCSFVTPGLTLISV